MSVKTMHEIEFTEEVKSRFSKMIEIDSENKLISVNDSAKKIFESEINQEIAFEEFGLETNEYDELIETIKLKLYILKGLNITIEVLGIIEKIDNGYKLFFEVLDKEGPLKYIANMQHFKMKRETWYKAIAYSLPDLIFIYDREGTYLDVIARYENWDDVLTGSALKLIGANLKDVLENKQSDEFLDVIRKVLKTRDTINFEYSLNLEYDQGIKHYSALVSPVQGEDAVIWVARETTELYNTRKEIEKAKEFFELSHKIKSSVISNLSHEVRTPLNIIMNTIDFLKVTNSEKTTLDQLKTIEKSSKHLLDLFENMVTISDQNMNDMKLNIESYNFNEMISSIAIYINESAIEKGLKMFVDISPNIPIMFDGDRTKISEIITHLISNSIKFTEKGSILLKAEIVSKDEETYLQVVVKDTGVGISEEDKKIMFNSFKKGKSNIYSHANGLGIGLTLVKKMLELMNGSITCKSELGSGTEFKVKIPISFDKNKSSFYTTNSSEYNETNVMILDSYTESREIVDRAFESFGFSTETFENLDSGINFIKNNEAKYTKILLLDDNCISSYVRANDICSTFRSFGIEKIIIATSIFDENVLELYSKGIIDDYIVKPMTLASIYNIVISKYKADVHSKIIEKTRDYNTHSALVVDDNFINREVGASVLKSLGLKVEKAIGGEDAFEKASKENFDIIFMDLEMPGVDGYMSSELIRGLDSYIHTPIVAMSANEYDDIKNSIKDYKFSRYMKKPMDRNMIIKILDAYLERSIIKYEKSNDVVCKTTDDELMKFPYLNYERVFERVCGDKVLILKMLIDFASELSILMEELSKSIENRKHEDILNLLHILKGTCGNLGFDAIYEEIILVEGKTIGSEYDKSTFDKLCYMLKSITTFKFNYKSEVNYHLLDKTNDTLDKDSYKRLLLELSESLSYGKIKDIKDKMNELDNYEEFFIEKDLSKLLSQKILRYRFKEASDIVKQMIEKNSL